MTYTPGIPNANDNISTSQGQIKTNFLELESIFSNDHYTWDDNTSGGAFRGYHKQVYFPVGSAGDPALGGFLGVLFTKQDPNDITANRPELYYRNVTETNQITNRFHSAATPGYVMVAGGIILAWFQTTLTLPPGPPQAFFTVPYTFTLTSYNYAGPGFPNATLSAQVTLVNGNATRTRFAAVDSGTAPTASQITINASSSFATDSFKINLFLIGN